MSNAFSKRNILFAGLGIIAIAVLGYYIGFWEQLWFLPAAVVSQHKLGVDIGYLFAHGNILFPTFITFIVDAAVAVFGGIVASSFLRKGQTHSAVYAAVVAWYGTFLTIGFMNVLGLVIFLAIAGMVLWASLNR